MMELWIRSQDKMRLIPNPNLYVVVSIMGDNRGKAHICDTMIGHIAHYKTKERALEVLDEIQNLLKPKYLIRMDKNVDKITNFLNINGEPYIQCENNGLAKNINNTFVCDMPEE